MKSNFKSAYSCPHRLANLAHSRRARFLAAASVLGMVLAMPAHAATVYWNGGNGTWETLANWSTTAAPGGPAPSVVPLSASADTLIFNTTGTNADGIIYLNGTRGNTTNSANITINNTGTTTFLGGNSTASANNTFASNSITVSAGAGTVTFGTTGALAGIRMGTGNAITNNSGNVLTIAGSLGSRGTSGTPDFTLGGSGNIDFTGQIGVGGTNANVAITKSGNGLLTLAGNNLYNSTTTINAGTVRVSSSTGLGTSAGGTSVATAGGKLELSGGITVAGELLTLNARATSAVHLSNYSGNNTWTGNIATNTGGSFYNIESQTATFTISGNLTNGNTGNRSWQLMGAGDGVVSGTITNGNGTVFVNKPSGAGTWTLSGNNTYTGSTVVTAGTLVVSGSGSINSSSSVTVSTGATLTNNSAAALTPGLSLSEGSTLSGSGSFTPSALTVTADLAGGTFTMITVDSAVFTKSGALAFTLTNAVDTSFSLFGGATTPGGSFTSVSVGGTPLVDQTGGIFSAEVGGFNYSYNDNFNSLAIAAVPEPATWAMVGLGMTFVLYRRRFARTFRRRNEE